MARSIIEIKREITTSFLAIPAIQQAYGLSLTANFENEFSKVSIENILFDVIAFSIYTLEKLFDTHKTELSTALAEQKVGTLSWYRSKALAFQYGFNLKVDSDLFDNSSATNEQIENSKIVKYSAVVESSNDRRVIIKIATENAGFLTPITGEQNDAFQSYIEEIRFAGVKTTVINYYPDKLLLVLKIYRDPLLIDASGNSILNGGKPVEEAIKQYMKELPFNGELVLAHLIDKLQQVEGVIVPHILSAQSAWIDPTINGYGDYEVINVKTIPISGYFQVENFDSIQYVV
jgi:hypothetical protein